jgi:biotin carboxylase
LRAAEILNLRGYCGVDLVLGKKPYVIEVNPRLTTSFIALARVLDANLGELLIGALSGDFGLEVKIKKHSVVKSIEPKRDVRVNTGELNKLCEIEGMVAPPPALNGMWRRSTRMLFTGIGKNSADAERKFKETTREALSVLGVDESVVSWP